MLLNPNLQEMKVEYIFNAITEYRNFLALSVLFLYLQKQVNSFNIYQQNFLTWSLKRKSVIIDLSTPHPRDGEWCITYVLFYLILNLSIKLFQKFFVVKLQFFNT